MVVVATGAVAEMVVAMMLPFEGDILSHVGRGRERKVSSTAELTVCPPILGS